MGTMNYGTVADADEYAASVQGGEAWAELTEAQKTEKLTQASLYVDALSILPAEGRPGCFYRFPGQKAGGYNQALLWPRRNAVLDGEPVPVDAIPAAVEQATYMAAVRFAAAAPGTTPGLPPTNPGGMLKRRTVGPLTQEFAVPTQQAGVLDPLASVSIMPDVLALLRGLLLISCGAGGRTAIMAV